MVAVSLSIALLLVVVSVLMLRRGLRIESSQKVLDRMQYQVVTSEQAQMSALKKTLLRADIRLTSTRAMLLAAVAVVVLLVTLVMHGVLALLVMAVLLALGVRVFLAISYQRRVSRMVEQLPPVLDHVVRSLKSGRSLGDALLLAFEQAQAPLHTALRRPTKSIQHGMSVVDALDDFARLYDREAFHMLAMCVAVNQRHGGNASEVLDNLITLIRDHDLARRQLRALTGETRMSALVLGGLPIVMAGYMFFANPELLIGMWQQSLGQAVLLFAFGLQLVGVLLLWRMVRSI